MNCFAEGDHFDVTIGDLVLAGQSPVLGGEGFCFCSL